MSPITNRGERILTREEITKRIIEASAYIKKNYKDKNPTMAQVMAELDKIKAELYEKKHLPLLPIYSSMKEKNLRKRRDILENIIGFYTCAYSCYLNLTYRAYARGESTDKIYKPRFALGEDTKDGMTEAQIMEKTINLDDLLNDDFIALYGAQWYTMANEGYDYNGEDIPTDKYLEIEKEAIESQKERNKRK